MVGSECAQKNWLCTARVMTGSAFAISLLWIAGTARAQSPSSISEATASQTPIASTTTAKPATEASEAMRAVERTRELEQAVLDTLQQNTPASRTTARSTLVELARAVQNLAVDERGAHELFALKIRRELDRLDGQSFENTASDWRDLAGRLPAGDPTRFEVVATLFQEKAASEVLGLETAAALLVEVAFLQNTDRKQFENLQYAAIRMLYEKVIAKLDLQLAVAAQREALTQQLSDIGADLVERGVVPGVARLIDFGQVIYAEKIDDGSQVEEALATLAPVVAAEEVGEIWRALYWNKWTEQHIKRRRYAEAFEASRQLLRSAEAMDAEEIYVIGLTQIAHLSLRMGDYAAAKTVLDSDRLRTAYAQSQDPRQVCTWKVNLAKALEGESAVFPARGLLEQAQSELAPVEAAGEVRLLVLNNLAINHYLAGDLVGASDLLLQYQHALQDQPVVTDLQNAEVNINLGWIALGRHNVSSAKQRFLEAARFIEPHGARPHPRYAEALCNAARAATYAGDSAEAQTLIRRAERLSLVGTQDFLRSCWSEQDRLAIVQEARVHPESVAWPGVLDTLLEIAPALDMSDVEQYGIVLHWKGLLDQYRQRDRQVIPASVREQEVEWNAKLREAYFRKVPLSQRNRVQLEIRALEEQLRELRRQVQLDSQTLEIPGIDSGDSETAVRVHALPQLGQGHALLDIVQIRKYRDPSPSAFGAGSEFLAFLCLPDGTCQRFSMGDGDTLEAAIGQWREAIINDSAAERTLAGNLAVRVQQPIIPALAGIERLSIRADGAMYLLPWAALPGVDGQRFWIENLAIELVRGLPDQAVKTSPVDASDMQPSLLLVGGVDYGPLKSQWEDLPSTRTEVKTIRALFNQTFNRGECETLSGLDASESQLLEALPQHAFVHLATHGYFLKRESTDAFTMSRATSLLNNGIVLAPAAEDSQVHDQYLSAAEIGPLDLHDVQLVMLSACETGMGKVSAGQGIEGLVSSFQNAGARRVIGSLWKVPDAPTAVFAEQFYRHLWVDRLDYPVALRRAQMDMLSAEDAELKKPVAWAAFLMSAATLQ